MKNTMILFAMAILLLSCKKDKIEVNKPNVSVTFWSTLYHSGSGTYIPLDSTQFKVYVYKSAYDTTLFQTGYSGKDGKFTSTLLKGKTYLVVATSRSYKFSYDTEPHYYKDIVSNIAQSPRTIKSNDFIGVNTSINSVLETEFSPSVNPSSKITGYGCTNYFIQDPTE